MKIKYLFIILFAAIVCSCSEGYEHYDGIYISGADGNDPSVTIAVDDQFPKEVSLIVSSTKVLEKDVTAALSVNSELVSTYNKEHQTDYELLPSNCYVLSHATVLLSNGNFTSTVPVKLNIISNKGMEEGKKYIVPVSITNVSSGDVIEASRTVFVKLNQIIVTAAGSLNSSNAFKADFSTPKHPTYNPSALQNVTFEARVYLNSLPSSWFCSLMGLEENLLLRVSTFDSNNGCMEVTGGGINSVRSKDPFPTKKWTHVAMTFEGSSMKCRLYIDGELVSESTVIRTAGHFPINLTSGYEAGNEEFGKYFFVGYSANGRQWNGYISEARVWAKALSQSEIRNNACYVDPKSDGLLAYWRFNDNKSVEQITDATENGYNLTKIHGESIDSWMEGVRCPE